MVFGVSWNCWDGTCGCGVCGHQTVGNWDLSSETAPSKLTQEGGTLDNARILISMALPIRKQIAILIAHIR